LEVFNKVYLKPKCVWGSFLGFYVQCTEALGHTDLLMLSKVHDIG